MVRVAVVMGLAWPAWGQPPMLTPPEGFVLEGMPPIPASIADERAPYAHYRYATFVAWHPTRREMIVGTAFGDTMQYHRVAGPGMARSQLTFFSDGLGGGQRRDANRATFDPTAGRYLVFQRDIDGRENFQNYRYDFDSAGVILLTDGHARNTLGAWSGKGDRMAYTSTRRDGRDYDLYIIDPADPSSDRLLSQAEGFWEVVDWSDGDGALLAIETKSASESSLWRVATTTGEKTEITPPTGAPVSYAGAVLSRDGRSIYVTTDRDSDFLRLARIDVVTGALTVLTGDIDWDVQEFALSPDGALVAFVTNEDGAGVLRLLDVRTGKPRAVPALPAGLVSHLSWRPDGAELAFEVQSPRSAGDVYSLDVPTGRVDRWTTSETGGLNPESLAEPGLVHWTSFDGRRISGVIYRPPTRFTGRRPVMLNIHGGPEAQWRPGWIGRSNYFLNELGVVIIYPNVRGSAGFGKAFMSLDDGVRREGAIKDIGALLDWIASQPDLDKDRVMVTGASYGGFLTLAAAAAYPDRIRCAFAGMGPSDLATFLETTHPARQDLRRAEYGDERDPTVRAVLDRISPLAHADRIRMPLFLAHDRNDTSVPYEQSARMAAAVRQNGTPVWFLSATDQGHGLTRASSVEFLMNAWALFMKTYLLS